MTSTIKEGLSHAARQLLRPLVRLLLSQGISYMEFAELAKHVFVESAIRDFRAESEEISRSSAAVLTGVTEKEVDRILADTLHAELVFNPQGNRLVRILQAWYTEQEFIGPYGMPLEIPWQSDDANLPSFSKIVRLHGGGINPDHALKEFIRAGAVVEVEPRYYKVLRREYQPKALDPAALERFGSVVANFMETIVSNFEENNKQGTKFERVVYVDDPIGLEKVVLFDAWIKREGQRFLEQIDDWFIAHMRDSDENSAPPATEEVNTGVGIYHYEISIDEEIPFAEYLRNTQDQEQSDKDN